MGQSRRGHQPSSSMAAQHSGVNALLGGIEAMRSLMDDDTIAEKMRSLVETTTKFFQVPDASITINFWPIIIAVVLVIAAIPFAFNFLVPFYSLYKAAYSGYHRSSDYEEDDYYDGGYDRYGSDRDRDRDRDFRRRRRPLRPRYKEDEGYSAYEDGWQHEDDYFRSWDRQSKQLPEAEAGDLTGAGSLVLGLGDSIAQ